MTEFLQLTKIGKHYWEHCKVVRNEEWLTEECLSSIGDCVIECNSSERDNEQCEGWLLLDTNL